jgi:murein DD-endopeptidase MepM/ murein hydrolase activator NlpD
MWPLSNRSNSVPERIKRKTASKAISWLVASNIFLAALMWVSLIDQKMGLFDSMNLGVIKRKESDLENKEQWEIKKTSAPSFILYDLPLPDWARGFQMPIEGAKVPQNESLLPGAPRNYRNGRHEGIDIFCAYGTPVLTAKDGFVLAVGSDYQELPGFFRLRLLKIAGKLFLTPPEILDLLHGRRIIIDHGFFHGRWVITVYSHLSQIEKDLKPGDFVRQGQVIGYVGTSGTSQAGSQNQAHLHFEIRVNGHPLGEGMSPKEAGKLYEAILNGE